MGFSKIENFLAQNIEGFFNRKFASNLQLPELKKFMERTILANKRKVEGKVYIPNKYVLTMTEKDYELLHNAEVMNALKIYVLQLAATKDFYLQTKPMIEICKAANIKPGLCEIKAYFKDEETNVTICDGDVSQGTIIAPSHTFKSLQESMDMQNDADLKYAYLHVYEGPDIESYLEIGEHQIHLGRREQNEFILTDPNVSRLHAYITFKQGRHFLTDAKSLNGISVDDKKVTSCFLRDGNIIKLGNTKILYSMI